MSSIGVIWFAPQPVPNSAAAAGHHAVRSSRVAIGSRAGVAAAVVITPPSIGSITEPHRSMMSLMIEPELILLRHARQGLQAPGLLDRPGPRGGGGTVDPADRPRRVLRRAPLQ